MDTIKRNDEPLREIALFAGAGGGILGGQLLGWRTVCAVEYEPHARAVLCARQNDGCLEPFPIWDDVRTFDGTAWRGRVDIVSGGFPCQDISCAGKGAGITGERSGLWGEMARIIGEIRPRYAWIENSPMLTLRGLDRVLCDLASMGYDATWGVVGAGHAGANHLRERCWILADANQGRRQWTSQAKKDKPNTNAQERSSFVLPNTNRQRLQEQHLPGLSDEQELTARTFANYWSSDPADEPKSGVGRVAHGVAHRIHRLERIGNGQCPQAMALAWNILSQGLT